MVTIALRAGLTIILFTLLGLLGGCATHVRTDVNSFRAPAFDIEGVALAVVPEDPQYKNSLEFQYYQEVLEQHLAAQGFRIVAEADARYLARLGYHISDGEIKTESSPVTGQTGYDTVFYTSVVRNEDGSHSYVRSAHWVPTFGIVGSTTRSYTNFTTLVTIDIIDSTQVEDGVPAKVYEVKARSEGSCGIVSRIFDEMLEAIFRDFPGENNRVERVSVEADMSCY